MPDLRLTAVELAELVRRATARHAGRDARRARLILLIARGASWSEAMRQLHCSRAYVGRWLGRFRQARLAGLTPHHRGGIPRVITPRLQARLLRLGGLRDARGAPLHSTRELAARLHVSHMTVHRLLREHGVR